MKRKSPIIYRSLLREALLLAWQRKTLWIFGFFAAFVFTGGVFDVAVTGLRRINFSGSVLNKLFNVSFFGYGFFSNLVSQIKIIGTFGTAGIIIFTTLIFIGLIFLAVLSQTSLIHGLKAVAHEHPNIIRKRAQNHFGRIFLIDVMVKIIGSAFVIITTLPFLWFYSNSSLFGFLIIFIQTVLFFSVILILNIIAILAVIHVIETGATVREAINHAGNLFLSHWLATFEFAVLLFLLISLSAFVIFGFVILLTVPYAFVYMFSILTGSFFIFVTANILFILFSLFCIFAFCGAVITFQYGAWYLFYKQMGDKIHKHLPLSKTFRLFRTL